MMHSIFFCSANKLTSSRVMSKGKGKGEVTSSIKGRYAPLRINCTGVRKDVSLFCVGLMTIFLISCSTEPEPLVYGTDVCHFCKMTLMDNKFGSELVTKKGKVYKFDDLNCFLNFYNAGYETDEEVQHKLVIDYSNPGTLINAADAFYLKSSEIRSPMNSEVAAFESKDTMDKLKKQWKGIYLAWGEVVTQYK